ncbi:hypothetical protein BpHYR1_042679 [Brachionus plicatilis]|uniref:Uncharacterized protein n=1 Tax=Brachionus plicatilis TaxID=10195 RepID=A0A3M7QPR9_BRAPC|nr:hypothetical protein BpHYR1_042679 [Brachionus plicatilis]
MPINGELTDNFICGFYNNQIGKFHYTAIVPNSIKSSEQKKKMLHCFNEKITFKLSTLIT